MMPIGATMPIEVQNRINYHYEALKIYNSKKRQRDNEEYKMMPIGATMPIEVQNRINYHCEALKIYNSKKRQRDNKQSSKCCIDPD